MSRLLRPFTLRARLTILWALVALTVVVGLELLTLTILAGQLRNSLDRDLELHAARFQQAVDSGGGDLDRTTRAFLAADSATTTGLAPVYRVELQDGSVLTSNDDPALLSALGQAPEAGGRPLSLDTQERGRWRVLTLPITDGGRRVGRLGVALSEAPGRQTVDALIPLLALAAGVLVAAGTAVTYLLTGRALAVIRRITAAAASIGERDLGRRVGYSGPHDEVGQLAATFDVMLSRLQSGFDRRQSFYALASHELRTPLTIARGQLEVLRRKPHPPLEAVHKTLDVAVEELGRVTAQLDDMLLLGRMLLGRPGPRQEVEIGEILKSVIDRARVLGDRQWELDVAGRPKVAADGEQLERAVLNLVVNAVRHTEPGQRVRLAAAREGDRVRVEVEDSGAGISAEDLGSIFEPWFRGRARRGEPGGLGLTIVREVVLGHGGKVDVESRLGSGTRFTILLPAAA